MDPSVISPNLIQNRSTTALSAKGKDSTESKSQFLKPEVATESNNSKPSDPENSAEQKIDLAKLKAKDREVRAHESAHRQVAGRHIRGRTGFKTEQGSDGREYAVAGDVKIDSSAVANDIKATLAKAQLIERAALAPANPSTQDRAIAAQAARMAATARAEISRQRHETLRQDDAAMDINAGISNANMKAIGAFQSLQSSETIDAIDLVV